MVFVNRAEQGFQLFAVTASRPRFPCAGTTVRPNTAEATVNGETPARVNLVRVIEFGHIGLKAKDILDVSVGQAVQCSGAAAADFVNWFNQHGQRSTVRQR